jgi:hypothetical protein
VHSAKSALPSSQSWIHFDAEILAVAILRVNVAACVKSAWRPEKEQKDGTLLGKWSGLALSRSFFSANPSGLNHSQKPS